MVGGLVVAGGVVVEVEELPPPQAVNKNAAKISTNKNNTAKNFFIHKLLFIIFYFTLPHKKQTVCNLPLSVVYDRLEIICKSSNKSIQIALKNIYAYVGARIARPYDFN